MRSPIPPMSFRAFLERQELALPPPPPRDRYVYLRQLDRAIRALAASSWYQSQEMKDYVAGRIPPGHEGD